MTIINLVEVFMIHIPIKKKTKWRIFVKMILIKIRNFKSGTRIKMMKELNKENTNILKNKMIWIKNLIFCNINSRKWIKFKTLTHCLRYNLRDSSLKLEGQIKLKSLKKSWINLTKADSGIFRCILRARILNIEML